MTGFSQQKGRSRLHPFKAGNRRKATSRLAGKVVVVRSGRCELDIYDDDHTLVATRTLNTGDLMLMVGGGHGYRMLEDSVLLEVKQGPYVGLEEKVLF